MDSSSRLLERLGKRLRERRDERALSRRELAEISGLSERFLGLLEGGKTNVSVTRLDELARALGTNAAALLDDPAEEPLKASQRRTIVALLGLRGAGKSAIGGRASVRLGIPFVELDNLVAERAGMSLNEIFEMRGAETYRKLEREALEALFSSPKSLIVATGGGLVTEHATYALLRERATTVWLRAKPEDHWNRVVAQGDPRPMAHRTGAMKELRSLLRARRALYEKADFAVDTSKLGLTRSVDRVVKIARDSFASPKESARDARRSVV